jgi:septation ring formation regulator
MALINGWNRRLRMLIVKSSHWNLLLDDILAKETAQRQEVTTLKNRFRALKSQAQENASRLSFNWSTIEQKIDDTEKMFTTFEEWMFSSDFDKANAELDTIRNFHE